jgi:hypothetical protein
MEGRHRCRDNALATSLDASAILGPEFPESVRKMSDERQFASATLRNRDFTLDVLRGVRRRRVSSSKSQTAQASTSSISREISRPSFSNLNSRSGFIHPADSSRTTRKSDTAPLSRGRTEVWAFARNRLLLVWKPVSARLANEAPNNQRCGVSRWSVTRVRLASSGEEHIATTSNGQTHRPSNR